LLALPPSAVNRLRRPPHLHAEFLIGADAIALSQESHAERLDYGKKRSVRCHLPYQLAPQAGEYQVAIVNTI
jgi:hypothetical protein